MPLPDITLRENDVKDTELNLITGIFEDKDIDGRSLAYSVAIADVSAIEVPKGDVSTWVTPYLVATFNKVSGKMTLRPRTQGNTSFKVTATDVGPQCRPNYTFMVGDATATPATVDKCIGRGDEEGKTTQPNPDSKSISDTFDVKIETKTTPIVSIAIGPQSIISDKDALVINLEDLNGEANGEPMAFIDPTKSGLKYKVMTQTDTLANISVKDNILIIEPIWRVGDASTDIEVLATNNLDEEGSASMFKLTVKSATKPILNPITYYEYDELVFSISKIIADSILVKTGDASLVLDLMDVGEYIRSQETPVNPYGGKSVNCRSK